MKKGDVQKKHVVVLIIILVLIVISIGHSWYTFYKFLYGLYDNWKEKSEAKEVMVTTDDVLDLPEEGAYYNEYNNTIIIIYSVNEPMIMGDINGYDIIVDHLCNKKYSKYIYFTGVNNSLESIDHRLIAVQEPFVGYYEKGGICYIQKTQDGIEYILTNDDGSILQSTRYNRIY